MSNPADNTGLCPVCGLAPQVRGCTAGKCRGGAGFAIVHAPVRPGAPFVANPGDFFNGWPLSAFCETCRLGILEIGRTERTSVTICSACTAMMMQPSPAPGSGGYAAPVDHPLPWRWKMEAIFDESPPSTGRLLDAGGAELIGAPGTDYGLVSVPDPYVRAVTERAGAMEALLRRLLGAEDLRDEMGAVRKLVGEIDAAAKGGG